MKMLIQQATIAQTKSPFNGLRKDILIENGIITQIADAIEAADNTVIASPDLVVSEGWIDTFAHFNDPGLEYNETLETGANAAAAGGFTQVFVLPNTQPTLHAKTQVEYIVQKSKPLPITIHPLGAVTKLVEGKELAEMYDMKAAGAIAFSDGLYPVQTAGLLLKALQYVKAIDATIIQMPIDKSIGAFGLMNEGIISTQLGLPGIPAIAEELMLKRDIDLVKYTGSKLHVTGITTAKSVALIEAAKQDGLQITCSVAPYHLVFCDEDLQTYDTNLKTNLPLRTRADMLALRTAVLEGKIDAIASHHQPQNWDNKVCEFEYAKYGMTGLQTAFNLISDTLPQLTNAQLVQLFSENVRDIFNIPAAPIAVGAIAELTLFSRSQSFTLTKANNQSKSVNSPVFDKALAGKVIGIIAKGQVFLNK